MAVIIRGAQVLTLDPRQPAIPNGAVLIEGETILAVDTYESLKSRDGIETELGDEAAWILPGFVNAHYHNWRTFSMGATSDAPLELFMLAMSGLELPEGESANEFNYLNTLVSALQLIHSGVTTTLDMSLSSNHQAMIQAYLDLGLDLIYAPTSRTQLGYVYAEDETFLASLPAELQAKVRGKGLGLTGGYSHPDQYWQSWLNLKAEFGDRIQLIIAPDGPEWCSEDELKLWCERAQQEETYLHLHNSESPMEMQWALQTRHQTMTEYLAEIGFLSTNVSCGHGVWYSDRDIELLARSGATTVHCPSSNLRLSNGIAPIADYLQSGVNVALGTDGQGLADTSDYLDEMRLAAFLQRTPGLYSKALSPRTVFEMATVNGANAFGREHLGALKPGNVASLVVLDSNRMRSPYLWPGYDPYEAVLQRARPKDINTVLCRGRVLMQNGCITTVNEEEVISRLQALYEAIWQGQTGESRGLVKELEPYLIQFFDAWKDLPVRPRYQYNRL
jgi:5-methylthioadenosine/S-adenosylhomocysteine deaminase